jgi:hypothetical protein
VAFFSCSEGEKAYEHADLKHGVFFHFVIEGLRGAAADAGEREIVVPDLEKYVKRHVRDFVREKYGVRQMPELTGSTRELVPLAIRDLPPVPKTPAPRPDPPERDIPTKMATGEPAAAEPRPVEAEAKKGSPIASTAPATRKTATPAPVLPPVITLFKPQQGNVFNPSRRCLVDAVATSQDHAPILGVEVSVNHRIVPESGADVLVNQWTEETRKWSRQQWITLKNGENLIEVSARNPSAKSKQLSVRVTYEPSLARPLLGVRPTPAAPGMDYEAKPSQVRKGPSYRPALEASQPAYLGLVPNPKMSFVSSGVWLGGAHYGSPAYKSGIKGGDVLSRFNGRDIRSWNDYKAALRPCRPGQTVAVEVMRVGRGTNFNITLEAGEED